METRPLTNEEREYLKRYFGTSPNEWPSVVMNFILGFVILTSLIFFTIKILTNHVLTPPLHHEWTESHKHYLLLSSMAVALIISQRWARSILKFKSQSSEKVQEILRHNRAEVYTINVQRAAELKEYEDEGVGFFLETDNRNVLFLRGQDLYEYASDFEEEEVGSSGNKPYGAEFPSTNLTFIRDVHSGIRLGLISHGKNISNVIKLDRKSLSKKSKGIYRYIGPEDGHFYDGSLEDVLASFQIDVASKHK